MLQFYFDHNMSPAIASGLQRRGVNVLIAKDDGAATWADDEILVRATKLDRVVCTQGKDFLKIARHWQNVERDFPGIVYLRQLDIGIGGAVNDLEMVAKVMSADEMRGRIYYLPLGT